MSSGLITCPHCGQTFDLPGEISIRELEVLEHIARGEANKEIARHLSISDQTVKHHITSIFRKLHATNRTQACISAIRAGYIPLN